MKLQDGHAYTDRWGHVRHVVGPTREHAEWVWTREGDWYVRETGQFITYIVVNRNEGRHEPVNLDHPKNLVKEIPNVE